MSSSFGKYFIWKFFFTLIEIIHIMNFLIKEDYFSTMNIILLVLLFVLSLVSLKYVRFCSITEEGLELGNIIYSWDEVKRIRFLPIGLFYLNLNGKIKLFPPHGYIIHLFGLVFQEDSMYAYLRRRKLIR